MAVAARLTRDKGETAERQERERLIAELKLFRDMTTDTVERMPLGFVALDHRLHVTYANPVALALTRMSLTELTGRRPWDLFPQIVGTRYETVTASAGITVEYEEHFASQDRWVGVLACPTQTGIAVFLRDITARKSAEETVRRSVALMHGSLDAMLDSFVICSSVRDDQGRIVDFHIDFANGVAGAFMGRAPDILIGALILESMPHVRGTRLFDVCRTVVETGEGWRADAVDDAVPGPDGDTTRRAINIQVSKFGDGFFATWRDVTERERARLERERLAAVVEQAIDGIVITDAASTVTYANPAFLAANDLALEDVVGRPAAAVTPAIAGLDAIAVFDVATAPRLREIEQRGPDGTTRRLEISVTPAHGGGGSLTGYVVVIRDVSALHEAEAELAVQARVHAALAEALHNVPAEATLEHAAKAICDQLVTLAFVDVAVIQVFLGGDDVQVLAQSAPQGYPLMAGTHLPRGRAATVLEHAAVGPWARYAEPDPADGGLRAAAVAEGLKAVAYGPIVHGAQVVGALVIGTFDERFARMLVEKMPGIVSFGATSSALLAERMQAMRQEADLRGALEAVLATRSFHPVFQPIVELESGEVVGYEALTRFDSGQRPDLCFADAWSVGLGADLESATIEAAIVAARDLPGGRWLDVNLSPRMLGDPDRLRPALWSADRPIVLEITEHDIIEDYGMVREAVRALGNDIRLAVDDAGAGVANFGHIIELRPDFVKLDISLVRRVNANLGRQAMVVGMRHFSRTAGCRLVAEGIETEEEARTLTELGVEFGQGYLFGYPETVEVWEAASRSPATDPRGS